MPEYFTTREIAALLRVKERQVYDLAAKGQLPVRRVTGKLLFPRAEIEAHLHARAPETPPPPSAQRPAVMAGGHDPLLEWALRESRSGVAAFLDGALDGLDRAAAGECIAAGLHIPDGDDWNVGAVTERFGHEPWVLISFATRSRGLILGRDLTRRPGSLREARGYRFQPRQAEAGSEKVLDLLLAREGLRRDDLHLVGRPERSETDLALAIAQGRAEVGLGIAAAARQCDLDFVPLIEERFDLLIWRKAYFDPPLQKFLRFCQAQDFRDRASALGGYDVADFGAVRFNAPLKESTMRPMILLGLVFALASQARAEDVSVAVAANFTAPAKEIAAAFAKKTGDNAVLSFGATGGLYTQITQDAPFEVFLAADEARPKKAVADGFAASDSLFVYAVGKLALWSKSADVVKDADSLKSASLARIAICNPTAAPYGAAAVATMQKLGLYDTLKPKLVEGADIAQAFQFVESGNAEIGFVALSQLAGQSGGSRWVVPQNLYPAIKQDAVLLKKGAGHPAAKAFLEFLKGPEAHEIIQKYGYGFDTAS